MGLEFWGEVVWWVMVAIILLPFVIGIVEDFREGKKDEKSHNSFTPSLYVQTNPSTYNFAHKSYEPAALVHKSTSYYLKRDPLTGVKVPPAHLCHKLINAFKKDVNKAVELLSNYYNVPAPKVIFNDNILSRSAVGVCEGNKIYLASDAGPGTLFHEFLHYLYWLMDNPSDPAVEEEHAERFAQQILARAQEYEKSAKTQETPALFNVPSPKICREILDTLDFEDLQDGFCLLSAYYGIKAPIIDYDENLEEDSFRCTQDKIYFGDAFIKLFTIFAAFSQFYAITTGKYVSKEDVKNLASEMIRRANEAMGFSAWTETTKIRSKRLELKMWKRSEEKFRKTLNEAFPGRPDIVEYFLREYGPRGFIEELEKELRERR